MSPAKQKSNERQAARDRKASARQAASSSTGASAYNPLSGTFHMLESISTDTGAGYHNGRFKSIDDVDDNASSNGGAAELECMSNNGSYSGESEDQLHSNGKEKHGAGKVGSQSGVIGGADKRDKVRGKNERKHQRQKERRAQELRDKCTGYLMSRKLEALSQQLVAMGFSQERATMALIFNDGHVEQSVAWLLEGGEGQVHEDWNTGGNPKIDISEELGHILEIEKKYKLSRPDIERAIVSCEGDLDKALECLRARSPSTSPNHEEGNTLQVGSKDSFTVTKEEPSASVPAMLHGPGIIQPRSNGVLQPAYQVRRDERIINPSTKGRLQASSINSHAPPEGLTKGYTHSRKLPNPLTDLQSSVLPAERRGYAQGVRIPLASVKISPPYVPHYAPVSKTDTSLIFGAGGSDPQLVPAPARDSVLNASFKEPVITGQTHSLMRTSSQPTMALSNSTVSSSPAFSPSSWSRSFMDVGSPSSVLYVNATHGDAGLKGNAGKTSVESLDLGASDMQCYNSIGSIQSEPPAPQWSWRGNGAPNEISLAPLSNSSTHSRSSSVTSYGLFTGWGVGLSQSSVDWSTGPVPNCDYRNIDWSMNASPTSVRGLSSRLNSLTLQEKGSYYWNSDEERRFQAGLGAASFVTESTNGHGVWKVGPSGAGGQETISSESGNTTAHEWTSPFAGKELFNLPQAVPSPSL